MFACLPACLCFQLVWAVQLPEVFALVLTLPCTLSAFMVPFSVSPFLAPHLLLFHSSHSAAFPGAWGNCSSRFPSTQRLVSVFGDTPSLFQCPFPGVVYLAPSPDI